MNSMRNQLLTATALLALSMTGPALADNNIGCGVGTIIWDGQDGVAPMILGATTNGSFGNQTFGISSGTLGCQQGGTVTAAARLPMFAGHNLDELAGDMAAGRGESLDVLANLYGIRSEPDRAAFSALTQAHFAQLFPSENVTAGQVLAELESLMANDARLADYVPKV
ncbi:MAG: DUF3015 domain-containing protein [Nitrococcus sp.]|nr:DUF3015 domain-containing protein [Nitrococcus sp.]